MIFTDVDEEQGMSGMEAREVSECECGCSGSCECAGERDYHVEPEQIDLLIECAVAYVKKSWESGTASEEDEDFLVVISALSDLWQAGAMSEKQRLFFEETFGLSGCREESACNGGCDGR